jgi:hypothetical protein
MMSRDPVTHAEKQDIHGYKMNDMYPLNDAY